MLNSLIIQFLVVSFAVFSQENTIQASAVQNPQEILEKLIEEQLKMIKDTKIKVEIDKSKKEEESKKTV